MEDMTKFGCYTVQVWRGCEIVGRWYCRKIETVKNGGLPYIKLNLANGDIKILESGYYRLLIMEWGAAK